MSAFSFENRKNLLAAGGLAPRPPWPPTAKVSPPDFPLRSSFAKSWVRH